ncbi:MAG TPA: hypothetical protein VGM33_02550 [Baekduia sp.]
MVIGLAGGILGRRAMGFGLLLGAEHPPPMVFGILVLADGDLLGLASLGLLAGGEVLEAIGLGEPRSSLDTVLLPAMVEATAQDDDRQRRQDEDDGGGPPMSTVLWIVLVAVRQRGSPESKPVGAPHETTAAEG